jgi:hypothetical protein
MAKGESRPSGERQGRLLRFYKKFNLVSGAVLLSAGVVLNSEILLALAALDFGQAAIVHGFEKWRAKAKSAKSTGRVAIAGAKA